VAYFSDHSVYDGGVRHGEMTARRVMDTADSATVGYSNLVVRFR